MDTTDTQQTTIASEAFTEDFRDRPPWWGGDLQTLRNIFVPPATDLGTSERLEFDTGDGSGDKLVGALNMPSGSPTGPLILLIHGLTGDQDSAYMRSTAQFHLARGRRVLRLNLRGAGPSCSVAKGTYYGGCVDDIRAVLKGLPQPLSSQGVFAIGYSLGGNILINVLGQSWAADMFIGATTVSAPLVPADAARELMKPRNKLYHQNLLRKMRSHFLQARVSLSPEQKSAIEAAKSVYELDNLFTAPRNGYRDADDYYSQTAGTNFVHSLAAPTLLLHARNDPWIPVAPYESLQAANPANANVVITKSGGHVGFHERGFSEPRYDRVAEAFLSQLTTRD